MSAAPMAEPKPVVVHAPIASASGCPYVAELRGVKKHYFKPDGTILVEALRGIDLKIPRGEYVAIMGASGSGKSTLMNILGCLDRPTHGHYLLDGGHVSEMEDETLSEFRGHKIGFVFQAFNLISTHNTEENVEMPLFYQGVSKADRRRRAIDKLNLVGLGDRLGHRPSELSGGQQQRVAIARALVVEPVVLMADEPTGNLDSATGKAILNMLDELHKAGMSIMMVTHDDSVAERSERIVRLKDGLIETDTRPA